MFSRECGTPLGCGFNEGTSAGTGMGWLLLDKDRGRSLAAGSKWIEVGRPMKINEA